MTVTLEKIRRLIQREAYGDALQLCRTYVEETGDPDGLHLLGLICRDLGDLSNALVFLDAAAAALPENTAVQFDLANALADASRTDEAETLWKRIIHVEPTHDMAMFNLAISVAKRNEFITAEALYREILKRNPTHPRAAYNLGNLLFRQNKFSDARDAHAKAVCVSPRDPAAWINLGLSEMRCGNNEAAVQALSEACALKPDEAVAHLNLGYAYLANGNLMAGWRELESRRPFLIPKFQPKQAANWTGQPLTGKRILIYAEQGHGDAIQFLRYADDLAARGADVFVQCHDGLTGLAETVNGVTKAVKFGITPDRLDYTAPIMSLPYLLDIDDVCKISGTPYMPVPAPMPLPDANAAFRVGLVWSGNPTHELDHIRSMTVEKLRPLLDTPKVMFYSLQVGGNHSCDHPNLVDLSAHLTDYSATAAAISALDLVISVDTSVIHLTGALGKTGWLALPHIAEWRWGTTTGQRTPWYDSVRLFRQQKAGDWCGVVTEMIEALHQQIKERTTKRNPPPR